MDSKTKQKSVNVPNNDSFRLRRILNVYPLFFFFYTANRFILSLTPVAGLFLTRLGFEKIFKTQ